MLHRLTHPLACLALLGGVIGASGQASGQSSGPRGPVTLNARKAFAERVAAQMVEVRRLRPTPVNITVPGRTGVTSWGWRLARGRVLCLGHLIEGWPSGRKDVLEVRDPGGAWWPAAPGVGDKRDGLVVLDVPGLEGEGDPRPAPAGPATLWAVSPAATQPELVVPSGQAPAPWGFYRWLPDARLVSGTPVVDAEGRLVHLAAGPLPGLAEEAGSALIPAEAVARMMARRAEWWP